MSNYSHICEALEQQPDLLAITANANIARELKTQILLRQDSPIGSIPQVTTLDIWLESQAQDLLTNHSKNSSNTGEIPQLASHAQILQIWESVIQQDADSFPDLQAGNLAPQANKAWLRLLQWQVPYSSIQNLEQYNQLQLSNWCEQFESRLEHYGLGQRDLVLSQYLASENVRSPTRPILFISSGDDLAPLHRSFIEKLGSPFKEVLWQKTSGAGDSLDTARCFQAAFETHEKELDAATAWAEDLADNHPKARIGILFTENDGNQKALIRSLKSRFSKNTARICLPESAMDLGIFNSAMQLLELNKSELSRSQCRSLIRNPFWGSYPLDIEQRTLWETRLCGLERKYLRPSDLTNTARYADTKLAIEREHSLAQRLVDTRDLLANTSGSEKTPQQWAELFSKQLRALGWPGKRQLTKYQKLQTELFLDCLQQLVPLGLVETKLSYSGVMRRLEILANGAQLPAQTPAMGINILNTVESALGFDYLWLIDASSDRWPGMVKPDLLIPIQIQIDHSMPRCHPEHERAFCISLFNQLRCNCNELVFSIGQEDTDQPREFSPLLPQYPDLDLSFLQSLEDKTEGSKELSGIELPDKELPGKALWIDCSAGPALDQSAATIAGGSSIFNLMAASPFVAFAALRLNAKPLPEAYLGIGPHHRGNILHACLDRLWAEFEDSIKLANTNDQELIGLIQEAVNQELLVWQSQHFNLDIAYFEQLKFSFVDLLRQWFEFERQRPEFAVLAREKSLQTQVGPLNLELRIDRIDQLADGDTLLIDYKSGSSGSENDLISSPPVAAQLPLYAISLEESIAGLCFAQVVSGDIRFKGISSNQESRPLRYLEDWADTMEQWRQDLTQLAIDYAKGDSRLFETKNTFGRRDELASLHRMAEQEELLAYKKDLQPINSGSTG